LNLVMGTVRAEPALWEAFVAAGGTWFDTARHYGDRSEGELGAFLERHGLRNRIFLVGKGAHTPDCRPEIVELRRSSSAASSCCEPAISTSTSSIGTISRFRSTNGSMRWSPTPGQAG
jgi:aryl-alcohol dehydrogenase-like predicted oxidoreductase